MQACAACLNLNIGWLPWNLNERFQPAEKYYGCFNQRCNDAQLLRPKGAHWNGRVWGPYIHGGKKVHTKATYPVPVVRPAAFQAAVPQLGSGWT